MNYPMLSETDIARQMTDTFGGYNHNLRIADGEFYDMKNLTSAYYPVLSPRGQRGVYAAPTAPQGMIAKDALCYVDGSAFVIGEYRVDMGLSADAQKRPKQLVSMGAYVVIFPDRKYINTADLTDYGDIDASFTTTGTVTFSLCRMDGTAQDVTCTQDTAPASPSNMDTWLDTSSEPHTLRQYSATTGVWSFVATTYIRIEATGIGAAFAQYDGVTISGLKGVVTGQLAEIDGSMVIWDRGDDYLVIVGILDAEQTVDSAVTVRREMPKVDFVIESQNRLWGCRYGTANNGDVVNEIYASKLGDFKNWNCFMGLSTDSYAASCGTDGQFTGAVTHLGYPLFFKENHLHKVYGNYPANYQIQTTACRGVQKGCENSLAIVGEVLYYKSRSGVCAYDGSLPSEVSAALGDEVYGNAVAGAHGNTYYISMTDAGGSPVLFVYDAAKGMWHKEDAVQAEAFCSCRGEMYYIDHADKKIRTVFGSGEKDTSPVPWMAETGIIGTSMPDKKYLSRLLWRMSLSPGAKAAFYVQYDSSGEWEYVCTVRGTTLRSFPVPIRPRRCDHLRLRIVGEGEAKIFSVTRTIEQGSDS